MEFLEKVSFGLAAIRCLRPPLTPGCFRAAGCHIGSSRRYNRPQIFSSQDAFVLLLAANFQDAVGFSRRLGLRFLSSQDAFVLLSGSESSRMPLAPLDVSASDLLVARMPSCSFRGSKLQDAMGSSRRFGLRSPIVARMPSCSFLAANLQDAIGSFRRFGLRSPSSQDAFVLLFGPGCFEAPIEFKLGLHGFSCFLGCTLAVILAVSLSLRLA